MTLLAALLVLLLSGVAFAQPQPSFLLGPVSIRGQVQGEVRFFELPANGNQYVGFKAPASITTSRTWTLPSDDQAGKCFGTDGAGLLSWVTCAGGSSLFLSGTTTQAGTVTAATLAHTQTYAFTSSFTTGPQFLLNQLSGNPTGGTLFEVRVADADVTALLVGDGTNGITVSAAGLLAKTGTGSVRADSLTPAAANTNGVLYLTGANAFTSTAQGPTNSVLTANAGVPSFSATPTLTSVTLTTPLVVTSGGTGTATALTAGSVVVAGASGVYTQDNANLFWDTTNKRLGIGTATPSQSLEVQMPAASGNIVRFLTNAGNGLFFYVSGTESYIGTQTLKPLNLTVGGTGDPLFRITTAPNFLFGNPAADAGTSAVGVVAIANGTAPTTSPVDVVQMWSADIAGVAGQAGLHIRGEGQGHLVLTDGIREILFSTSSGGGHFGTRTNHPLDFRTADGHVATLTTTANFVLGPTNPGVAGTNAAYVLAFENGTAPTTSPVDTVQLYAADVDGVVGQSGLHVRDEGSGGWKFGNAKLQMPLGTSTGFSVAIGTANVNTTAVGNIDAGADDLMTYTLPLNSLSANGKGVRVTARGTTANNANAKTLTFHWGGQTILSTALTANIAGQWEITALIIRTGVDTQDCSARLLQGATVIFDQEFTACTQDDGAAIIIKAVANTVTTTNDIVQEVMLVEFLN